MATWMLLSELALPILDWRGPCSSVGVGSQKGKQAGRSRERQTLPIIPFLPLLPSSYPQALSHLVLTPKQHQPPIEQSEGFDVPDRHIGWGRLRDLWGWRLRLWLGLWVEEEVLGYWDFFLNLRRPPFYSPKPNGAPS